jgi:hypothetical protein
MVPAIHVRNMKDPSHLRMAVVEWNVECQDVAEKTEKRFMVMVLVKYVEKDMSHQAVESSA